MNKNAIYQYGINRVILVLLISLTVIVSKPFIVNTSAKEDTHLTANISFSNGHSISATLKDNTTIKVKSSVGKLKFPINCLDKIKMSEIPNFATIQLKSGDKWVVDISDDILDDLGVENSADLIKKYGEIFSIIFNSALENNCFDHKYYMKLILNYGSQVLINSAKLHIPFESKYGKWVIPIGSLRALKFIQSSDSNKPDSVIMRLQTGLVQRMKLSSRKDYISTKDSYGNKIKVYYKNITGILNSTNFEDASTDSSMIENNDHLYRIKLKNGEDITSFIPVSLVEFKTEYGKLPILTPMIRSIKPNSDSDTGHTINTLYGEILPGRFAMRKLRIIAENDDGFSDIDTDKIQEISTKVEKNPIPDGWLVWYLKSGIAIIARFEDSSTGLLANDDQEVKADSIVSLTPTTENKLLLNTKQDGSIAKYKIDKRYAKVVLLTTGTLISIPWKDVCTVRKQKEITPECLQTMPTVVEPEINSKSNPNSIKLKTSFGNIELSSKDIADIYFDRPESKTCFTTIFNDKLVSTIPSTSKLEKLLNVEDYNFPDEDIFEIPFKDRDILDKSSAFTCRLTSGDIFYCHIPEQELSIKNIEKRSKSIDIQTSGIKEISRDDEGNLEFNLLRGNISAKPKERYLDVVLFVTGKTNSIPFKKIDSISVTPTPLPPVNYSPGLQASLKNEVFVKGGTYMQGSNNGMSDERPVHSASVSSFYMDSTEVTRAQFAAFVNDSNYKTVAEIDDSDVTWKNPGFIQSHNDPVVYISWFDAVEYCNWRSDQCDLPKCYTIKKDKPVQTDRTAMGYRLPTESEWEFAARNRGQDNLYAWNNASIKPAKDSANYRQEPESENIWIWTNPVQTFAPNGLGIYGLSGNVWEWCEDLYFNMAYSTMRNNDVRNPCIDLTSNPDLSRRVMRGGSFKNKLDLLRCTSRGNGQPYAFSNHVGFRCVRNAE